MIKNLQQVKGYTAVCFLREFESKNWTRSRLDSLLAKIDRSGSVDRVSGSGRPRTARAIRNVTVVEEMALSQEDKHRICTADCSRVWHSSVKRPPHHQDRPAAQVFKEVQCSSTDIG